LGLSGSEYHTYTLPKRVGEAESRKLLDEALPLSVEHAKTLGLVDAVFSHDDYYEMLHNYAKECYSEDFIWEKQDRVEQESSEMEQCKRQELERMYPEFWDEQSSFHRLRREFVYKVCPRETPQRLKGESDA